MGLVRLRERAAPPPGQCHFAARRRAARSAAGHLERGIREESTRREEFVEGTGCSRRAAIECCIRLVWYCLLEKCPSRSVVLYFFSIVSITLNEPV